MIFIRSRLVLIFDYYLNDKVLDYIVDYVNYLRILFTFSLNLRSQIKFICCCALKLFGFIKQTAINFKFTILLKHYHLLVWSVLEYDVRVLYGALIIMSLGRSNIESVQVFFFFFNLQVQSLYILVQFIIHLMTTQQF